MANDRHPVHVTVFDLNGRKKVTTYDDSTWGWPNEEGITDYVMSNPAKKYPDHVVEVDDGNLAWRFRTGRVAGQTSVRLLRKPRKSIPSSERSALHHATKKKSPAQLDREIAEVLSGWGVGGGAALTEDRVVKLTDDHINEIYRDAMARGDTKTAKLAAKAAYAYDKPGEKIAALAAHLAGKKGRRTAHATTKRVAKPRSSHTGTPKRYRLVIAGPTGRYTESEFTATKDEALAQARRELEQGAVYVRVDTDVDHLRRTYTPVTEMRK